MLSFLDFLSSLLLGINTSFYQPCKNEALDAGFTQVISVSSFCKSTFKYKLRAGILPLDARDYFDQTRKAGFQRQLNYLPWRYRILSEYS